MENGIVVLKNLVLSSDKTTDEYSLLDYLLMFLLILGSFNTIFNIKINILEVIAK
jgi:hypothetical protein